jgi:DNA-directed RNA polymerase specialized sigma24 family protein
MPNSDDFELFLPRLRRLARMLADDQQGGDAVVAATLETLADEEKLQADPRIALYRMFTRLWNGPMGQRVRALAMPKPTELTLKQRVFALTPRSRQAFMLLALDGFSLEEAASVLELPVSEVSSQVETARREVAQQIATDVLIIEDDLLIANDLKSLMMELGHRVIGIARTHDEALRLAKSMRPGLILADIELADGSSGIDAVNEIHLKCWAPVLFITAYPERLLTGSAREPTYLLAKPFHPDAVRVVVSQALFF